jgi:hypothetical protein
MSGGAMDYVSYKIEEQADKLEDKELIMLVNDIAKLMHDCEWYLSGDTNQDDYHKTVKWFKQKWFGKDERNKRLKEIVEKETKDLQDKLIFMIGV